MDSFITNIDRRYALYHLRKSLIRYGLILFVIWGLTALTCINVSYYGWVGYEPHYYLDTTMWYLSMNFVLIAVPLMEFYEFKNKRNLDTWFSFPISRFKLAMIHFINGALEIMLAYLGSGIVVMVRSMISSEVAFKSHYFNQIFLPGLLVTLAAYALLSFAFVQGNNVFDGVALAILYYYTPQIFFTVYDYIDMKFNENYFVDMIDQPEYSLFVTPFNAILSLISRYETLVNSGREFAYDIVWSLVIFWIVLGVVCAIGLVIFFGLNKTEKVGETSDSPVGLKVFIPMWVYMFQLMCTDFGTGIMMVVVHVIATVVYRRGIRLKLPDFIKIGISIILAIVVPILYKNLPVVENYNYFA